MPGREQALAYTINLGGRPDFVAHRQMFLQRRVFLTYNRLMRMFASRGMADDILDLGPVGDAFQSICLDNGMKAYSLGIEDGVDFECDAFPYDDASFDIACAASVIEHLNDPSKFLTEIFRVLRRGGHLILVTPHWPYCWREFWDAYTHKIPYSHKSLRAALETHGFEIVAMVPWMVDKPDLFWRLPVPWSFRLAALLPFAGLDERAWIPGWLKGRSRTLLALARRPR